MVLWLTSQLDWFEVLDEDDLPVLTEREVLQNLQAIVNDADKLPKHEVSFYVLFQSSPYSSLGSA